MSPIRPRPLRLPVAPLRRAVISTASRAPALRSRPASAKPAKPAEQAEALIRDIASRKARIADDFYEIGVALQKLSKPSLYQALGYTSLDELLKTRRVIGRAQAFKLMAVVQAYPKQLALRLGVEKGYALVRYTASTPAPDVARVLAKTNATIAGKRLHRMTVAELREETKRLASGPAASDQDTKRAREQARTLQRELRASGAKSAKVRVYREGAVWKLRIELNLDEAEALRRA